MSFDYVYTFVRRNNLSEILDRFELAGFMNWERKAKQPAGILSGFVRVGAGFIELMTVENEREFQKFARAEDRAFRKDPRPFIIGFASDSIDQNYRALQPRYPGMREPFTEGDVDGPGGPSYWTYVEFPAEATPGVEVVAVRQNRPRRDPKDMPVAPNSAFAFGGFYFCGAPAGDIATWRRTFETLGFSVESLDNGLRIGPQEFIWFSEAEYEATFGVKWRAHESGKGRLAAVKLLTRSVPEASHFLENAGFTLRDADGSRVIVSPDENTGLAFILEQGSAGDYA